MKQTEIPNDSDWFHSEYPADKAESWIGPYERELKENEEEFCQLFLRIANTDGQIVVRKVNDNPQPGHGLEWGMLHSAKDPLDFYFAS